MASIVRMPEVLAGASEAAIATWLVAKGQQVSIGIPLAEVETEKAIVEYNAEVEGTVLDLLVPEGDTVAVGDPILVVGAPGESVPGVGAGAGAGAGGAAGAGAGAPGPEAASGGETAVAPEPETAHLSTPAPTANTPDPNRPGGATSASSAGAGSQAVTSAASSASAPSAESSVAAAPSASAPPPESSASSDLSSDAAGTRRRFASPIVRRLAKERGIDLGGIRGTGPEGRITRRDLDAALATGEPGRVSGGAEKDAPPIQRTGAPSAASAPTGPGGAASAARAPGAAASTAAEYEDVPLTGMRRAIARRLTESKSTVPHFYLVADIRMDALLALRADINGQGAVRVSVTDLLLKAVAGAFRAVPDANAVWADSAIRRFRSADIALAVAIEGGLVTPVLRGVDQMSVGALAAATADVIERARAGRLKQHELEGGSFAISNLGMYGVSEFSAIINPPQSGILAVGAAQERPVVEDGSVVVRRVMTVTLSADHRVLDGALAAQWLAAFVEIVEHPLRILL